MLPLFYAVGPSGHFLNDGAKVLQIFDLCKFLNKKSIFFIIPTKKQTNVCAKVTNLHFCVELFVYFKFL